MLESLDDSLRTVSRFLVSVADIRELQGACQNVGRAVRSVFRTLSFRTLILPGFLVFQYFGQYGVDVDLLQETKPQFESVFRNEPATQTASENLAQIGCDAGAKVD